MKLPLPFFGYLPLVAVIGGTSLGFAWLYPSTLLCVFLTWVSLFCLTKVVSASSNRWYLQLFLFGISTTGLGFYWLQSTIQLFGGFPFIGAAFIYLLFVLGSALQFVVFGVFYRHSPSFLRKSHLALGLSWMASEQFSIRIFPWSIGHTQLAFLPFVQIADVLGAGGVTFLMFVICDCIINASGKRKILSQLIAPALLLSTTSYGLYRLHHFSTTFFPTQKVAVIQANVSLVDKHNTIMVEANEARYKELSRLYATSETLIIWPESVITRILPDEARFQRPEYELPQFPEKPGFLIGALTYNAQKQLFNSALPLLTTGEIAPPYHKQILMPFGEYVPLKSVLPWLRYFMPEMIEFVPGLGARIIEYGFDQGSGVEQLLKVAPLICYEDLTPLPSRQATLKGAELLINLTNDAWFGNTAALYQHHTIASFRAIENRRSLIRSTNTGLTGIISPRGTTTDSLKPFSEGVISTTVPLVNEATIYTLIGGDSVWFLTSLCMLVSTILTLSCGYWTKRKRG